MTKLKMALAGFALIALAGVVAAQQGFFPNFPIVGGASYSCGSVNGVSNCTVNAGPTALTGNETINASTNLANGQQPQNVLIKPASLNSLPITFVTVSGVAGVQPAAISANNLQGGVIYNSSAVISQANITLPINPIDNQSFIISSNRTITTLVVTASANETMGTNSAPTTLTASLTAPQGYKFIYNLALDTWFRAQ